MFLALAETLVQISFWWMIGISLFLDWCKFDSSVDLELSIKM